MRKLLPILLSALLFTGCASSNNQTNTYRQISMDEAVAMMAEETGYIILDVRRADEFATGHIPGAINVANESIGRDEIPELPDKNQLIMVYCRSGRRSKAINSRRSFSNFWLSSSANCKRSLKTSKVLANSPISSF